MATEIKDFGTVVATIVVHDKKGVTDFLKGQGVNVSDTASNDALISAVMLGSKNTKFAKSFLVWADNNYSSKANFSYNSADGGFDPMDAHYADGGFDPMDSQNGVSLKSDFANFDYGSADPILGSTVSPIPTGTNSTTATKSKVGTFLSGIDYAGLLNTGVNIFATSSQAKQQQKIADAQIKAKELEIQALQEAGKLSALQANAQLALLKAGGATSSSNTGVYIIAGVALLAVVGLGYFILKKKG